MTVHKTLIAITLLAVAGLIGGSVYYPDTFWMSFAASDPSLLAIRTGVAALLVALLVTTPPRSKELRAVIGAGSLILVVVATQQLFAYHLGLFDALVFMEVAIIFAIEALETRTRIPVRQKDSPAKKIPVLSV